MGAFVRSVHIGKVAPLGPDAVPSAFVKSPVPGPVAIKPLGLDGDEQADLRVHGGPEKAVYAYAIAHYAAWAKENPASAALFAPGSVGENLAIEGLDEAGICVGDVHAIGSATLQVCQPRQPCFKFALRFADNSLPKAMVRTGRSGWYYRVLQPGAIQAGDAVALESRPNPDFPFDRLVQIVYRGGATEAELARMAEMPGIASQWRIKARQALNTAGDHRSGGGTP